MCITYRIAFIFLGCDLYNRPMFSVVYTPSALWGNKAILVLGEQKGMEELGLKGRSTRSEGSLSVISGVALSPSARGLGSAVSCSSGVWGEASVV